MRYLSIIFCAVLVLFSLRQAQAEVPKLINYQGKLTTPKDTCEIRVVSVNDTISPQSPCGFNVRQDILNKVIIDVVGTDSTDSFTVDVRALVDDGAHRIDYRNNMTMPCTIMVSVDNWSPGTQNLFVHVENQETGQECVPSPLIIPLCVLLI
ncbi:MAG TPA: hypothetical protein VGB16_04320, partial [candidate division Zixibacteria bacterium]